MQLFICNGVIVGEHAGFAIANQIATGISHVSDGCAIEAKSADDDRRSHAGSRRSSQCLSIANPGICPLYQSVQQSAMRFHSRRSSKTAKHLLDGCSRGHFPLPLTTNSVCQRKEPAMRAHLLRRRRQDVSKRILVSRTDCTRIRELCEVYLQHGSARCNILISTNMYTNNRVGRTLSGPTASWLPGLELVSLDHCQRSRCRHSAFH